MQGRHRVGLFYRFRYFFVEGQRNGFQSPTSSNLLYHAFYSKVPAIYFFHYFLVVRAGGEALRHCEGRLVRTGLRHFLRSRLRLITFKGPLRGVRL